MALCALAWLSFLFWEPLPRIDQHFQMNWTVLTMLSDSQYGLTMVPIVLGAGGFYLWRWGSSSEV
jgi:hypothetical protein